MKFNFPCDTAKFEFLVFELFHTTGLIDKLPELLGFHFDDTDWSDMIEMVEQIQIRKQREYSRLSRTSVGRTMVE